MDMISYLLGYSTGTKRGGSGGGGDAGGWVSASGVLNPTSSAAITVQHNMGVKPDIVVLYSSNMPTMNMAIIFLSGVSSAVIDKGVTGSDVTKFVGYSTAAGGAMTFGINATIDSDNSMLDTYGLPRNLTTTEFTIGGGSVGNLASGIRYDWFAIGGIT